MVKPNFSFVRDARSRFFLTGAALLIAVGLAGCSDDVTGADNGNNSCNLQDKNLDLLSNALIREISTEEAAPQRIRVNSLDELLVETSPNSPVTIVPVTEGENQFLEIRVNPDYIGRPFVESVLVYPKNAPRDGRHIFITGRIPDSERKAGASTRATEPGDPMFSVYSEVLGKGTYSYGSVGNISSSVLSYDLLSTLGSEYVLVNTTIPKMEMIEENEKDAGTMMTTYAANLGVDFKKMRTTQTGYHIMSTDGGGAKIVPNEPKKTSISGTVNFGLENTVKSSYDYEYYLNVYNVKKAEVTIKMDMFELSQNRQHPDSILFLLVNSRYVEDMAQTDPDSFSPEEFFNDWGTDVITQGSFGGYCLYCYGRKENDYEHTLGIDASAQIKIAHPTAEGNSWLDVYKNNNSPHVSVNVDFGYKSEEYNSASKQQTYYTCKGGNMTDNNASAWLDGFNSNEDSDKWALINYRVGATDASNTEETSWNLYPIEQVGKNLLDIFVSAHSTTMTHSDSLLVSRMEKNIQNLSDSKKDYIEAHIGKNLSERTRIVVADFMMKNGSNGHKHGQPTSFVAADPRNANRYFIYYPIMANQYNAYSGDTGYALETTQNKYYNAAADIEDHYWYYALAHEDDCDGIVGVKFLADVPQFWTRRGDSSDCGGLAITDNYVVVRYYDPGVNTPSDKLTAVGLYSKSDDDFTATRVVGSSGGSELSPNATQTEYNVWHDFWQGSGWFEKTQWNEGTFSSNEKLWPCCSRRTLDYQHFKGAGVTHAKTW